MADINKMRKEINIILAAAEAENEQKEKMIQLHIAIEEFCAKLLQDAIIGTTIAVITAKKTIEVPAKALELNTLTKESCTDAAIYLWEELCSNNDPLSKRERQRAEKAIRTCLLRNKTISMNTIFCAISSVIV